MTLCLSICTRWTSTCIGRRVEDVLEVENVGVTFNNRELGRKQPDAQIAFQKMRFGFRQSPMIGDQEISGASFCPP